MILSGDPTGNLCVEPVYLHRHVASGCFVGILALGCIAMSDTKGLQRTVWEQHACSNTTANLHVDDTIHI